MVLATRAPRGGASQPKDQVTLERLAVIWASMSASIVLRWRAALLFTGEQIEADQGAVEDRVRQTRGSPHAEPGTMRY